MKKAVIIFLVTAAAVIVVSLVIVFGVKGKRIEPVSESVDTMDIVIPGGTGKLPVVFLAHNGDQSRADWGDFPAELARDGYAVVNMGWTDYKGGKDFKKNIDTVMKKYGKVIDFKRVAFVGGCHGGIKMLSAIDSGLPVSPKALVFLSMSELYSPPAKHAPILGIYSKNDHLGANYVATQHKVYESTLSEPKKVIALDTTPHGDELVTDAATSVQVRKEIIAWLAGLM